MIQLSRVTAGAALFLLLGAMAPAYAQRDQHRDKQGKVERREDRKQQQRARQNQQKAQRQDQRAEQYRQQPRRTQQQAAAWQQQRGWAQHGAWQGNTTWQQGRARQWEQEHRSWAQRGGYGGYYIPQARFSLYFGNQHWFRIQQRPTMYMGYPRFEYRGHSFLLVDPWPEYWDERWYEANDVYVDYDGSDHGYYLHNRSHPNVRLAITIVR